MYRKTLDIISQIPKEERFLISGGAAWSDHLAISLYLANQAQRLTLFIPSLWDQKRCLFYGNNNANTANYYHRLFSEKMGGNTLNGIQRAIDKGAIIHEIKEGFFARNLLVGQTDILIAFGWEKGEKPQTKGTLHTWNNSQCTNKIYIYIGEIEDVG